MNEKHVILYTTHCPACRAMEAILKKNGYTWTENTDVELMRSKGFKAVPWIEFDDGTLMNLGQVKAFFAAAKTEQTQK